MRADLAGVLISVCLYVCMSVYVGIDELGDEDGAFWNEYVVHAAIAIHCFPLSLLSVRASWRVADPGDGMTDGRPTVGWWTTR